MNLLVTGGTGFIGSHVCDALLRHGHRVRVLSRQAEHYRSPLPSVEYYRGDIENSSYLSEALAGMDCVVHLVSSTVPSTSNLDPVADVNSNLVSTLRLLELMRQTGPDRIVFLSSGGTVYGEPANTPVAEDEPLNPLCSYGVVKVAIENYLRMYQALYGLEPVIVRASNPYGPRQGHLGLQGLVAAFLDRLARGLPLEIWGDGEVVRDYFYVSDLAELCALVVQPGVTGTFNAGSGVGTSINQVVELIRNVTGIKPELVYQANRNFDVSKVFLDISLARDTFGWTPAVSLEEGILRHWNWLQEGRR
jgi:UDP-glucose 4-epimerase